MKKRKVNLKALLVILSIAYFSIIFIRQEVAATRLNKEIVKANLQLEEIKEQGERLKEQLEMSKINPEGFSERLARERLGLIKENETPVMPIPERQ
ncbi:FtsB family cell division protein [Clostridium thermarum]|uniref:FtsB family cell division protein n=1 Tax=Clostridium thermarum TaxID=1716543 RepID=UPI0013D8A134|nr:septum formation initiator family protein [Clostridium thermarum]